MIFRNICILVAVLRANKFLESLKAMKDMESERPLIEQYIQSENYGPSAIDTYLGLRENTNTQE